MKDLQHIEQTLRDALTAAKEAGWTIKRREFYNIYEKCCCAIGALAFVEYEGEPYAVSPLELAQVKFELDYYEAFSIAFGFDGRDWDMNEHVRFRGNKPLFDLGVRLANEFKPQGFART